jgi:hypothetical protein
MMIIIEIQRALGFWMLAIIRITDDGQNPDAHNPMMMILPLVVLKFRTIWRP